MDLPVTVKLKVIQADPGVKGDTAQGKSFLRGWIPVLLLGFYEYILTFQNITR